MAKRKRPRRQNPDEDLRKLQRTAATGDANDTKRYWLGCIRVGELPEATKKGIGLEMWTLPGEEKTLLLFYPEGRFRYTVRWSAAAPYLRRDFQNYEDAKVEVASRLLELIDE